MSEGRGWGLVEMSELRVCGLDHYINQLTLKLNVRHTSMALQIWSTRWESVVLCLVLTSQKGQGFVRSILHPPGMIGRVGLMVWNLNELMKVGKLNGVSWRVRPPCTHGPAYRFRVQSG